MSRPLFRQAARILSLACAVFALQSGSARAAEPPKPDQLVIRGFNGTWGDAFESTIVQMFTDRFGIPVVIDRRLDATVSLIIESAQAQGRQPPIDLSISLDASTYKEAARGVMLNLTPADIPALNELMPISHPVGYPDSWPYVNFAVDILTLVYRKSAFPDGPPTSLNVMFDPKYKNRTVASTTSLTTVMLVSLAQNWRIPDDMDKIWGFIKDRVQPMHPILGSDPEVVNALQRDEIDVAFTFPANAAGFEPLGIAWTNTKEGMYGLNEAFWIPRGLPEANTYWAKQFINFALSQPALQAYCTKLIIPCFRKDVTPPPGSATDPYFPTTPAQFANIHSTPFQDYTANQLDWDARYDAIMK